MIPEEVLRAFLLRSRRTGSISKFVRRLIYRFGRRAYLRLNPYCGLTTRYQARGQRLVKHSFTAQPEDYAELRLAARACGVTMCFLVIFLFQMDLKERQRRYNAPHVRTRSISSVELFQPASRLVMRSMRIRPPP
ncbi:MAG: DUF1564 family protein [Spirochaetales bacterium]|nr:DUF1564 family protein [Leptospiraceae bacterium]MCP5482879.1 DUF1564 family protein [Spirochaetales bacterium]